MLRCQTELPHVQQEQDWDCGLACVRMILQRVRATRFTNAEFEEVCKGMGFGSSVWTIDLANILTHFGVKYLFFTETLGVDMAYQTNSFYSGTFDLDEIRVNRLFATAPNNGLHVEKRTVSLEEVILKLNSGYVAIALTNSYFLHCDWCERLDSFNQLSMLMLSYCTKCTGIDDYCGHFIVLCGYDMEKKCFYYKNPSSDKDLCCMNFHVFEAAWHCYGTDSDIVFVNVQQESGKQDLGSLKPEITCGIQQLKLESQLASA